MVTAKELIASFPDGTRFGFDSDKEPFVMLPNFGRDQFGRDLCVGFSWEWDKPETLEVGNIPGPVADSFPLGIRYCSREEVSAWLESRI